MLGPLAPSAAADPSKGDPGRCHQRVSGTQAQRPLAHHLAGQHGSAAPHTSSSTVPSNREPSTGACASPPQRSVLGRKRVWVCRHTHGAQHSMRQCPQQPSQASRCERVVCATVPGLRTGVLVEGRGWGLTEASLRRLRGPSSGTALLCLGMGGVKGPGGCCLPHSLIAPLPARLPGHLLVQKGRTEGRADILGGWVGKRSGPAERLLQLLAGRWVPGAGKLGITEEGRGVKSEREQQHM